MISNLKNKIILAVFSLTASMNLIGQTNYFVADNGIDSNTGLSIAAAFNTAQKAVDVATHGDTINVLGGPYSNATFGTVDIWKEERTIHIKNKLNAINEDYLVIRPYQKELVKLNGDGAFIIQIVNSSYIHVEGFEIEGETNNIPLAFAEQHKFTYKDEDGNILQRVPPNTSDEAVANMTFPVLSNITRPTYFNTHGISVNRSHHIKILNNIVHHTPGEGIRSFTSDYLTINGNIVHNCSRRSATGVHGLSVYTLASIDEVTAYKVFIENNRVYDNYNEVYSWSQSKTIITPHIDEGKGITVQRCTPDKGWKNGRVLFQNNLTYNNGFSGLHVNSGERVDIINNTSYHNSFTGSGNQHGISAQGSNDIKIINNIIVNNPALNGKGINIGNTGSYIIKNNLLSGTIDADANAIDQNTIFADPLFVDVNNFDFSLQSTSSAIGAASSNDAPALDYLNNSRDTNPDIGAIERQACTPILALQNETISTGVYAAAQTINTNQTVTIPSFTFVNFYAGNSIVLSPGFSVSANSFFHAKIQDNCGTMSLTASESPEDTPLARTKIDFTGQTKTAIKVYPNPFRENIFLESKELNQQEISIFNLLGQNVTYQVRIHRASPMMINMMNLQKGIYILKVGAHAFTILKQE